MEERNEIIVYQPEGGEFHIDVKIKDETVWLTQQQMAELFQTSRSNVIEHIQNIYSESELAKNSTCRNFRQVRIEGNREVNRSVPYYNLDMIIALGYRVKSLIATRFRQWANQILKEHLLKGGSVNQRLISHENKLESLGSRVQALEKNVDFFVKANLPPSEGILNAKSWWSGYEFACQLVRSAKEEIIVIDPFADDVALSLVAKKSAGVNAFVYSGHVNRHLREEEERLNRQFSTVKLKDVQNVHDRFIIVDETVYHIGSSLNELGKKLTAFSVLNFVSKQQLLEMVSQASGKKNS